jgi:hypothetical protein
MKSNSASVDSGYTNLESGLFLEPRFLEIGISRSGKA